MQEQCLSTERHNMLIKEKLVNLETSQETIIERNMTEQEIADYELHLLAAEAAQAEAAAKEAARAELLARLGITADEAKLLLGGI